MEFDFLGKDSIRYYNAVSVEKRVFKNLIMFTDNKSPGDDVFDRLNVCITFMCFIVFWMHILYSFNDILKYFDYIILFNHNY